MDGMQLPYDCFCFRSAVLPHAQLKRTVATAAPEHPEHPGQPVTPLADRTDTADRLPRVMTGPDDGPDSEMILIDFR
jgi:hypothetical protein